MLPLEPAPLDEMIARLDRALAASPADATEIAWLEVHRGQESNSKRRRDIFEHRERTVMVRVRESGRSGFHRTGASSPSDLENAVRLALAQARLSPRTETLAARNPADEKAAGALTASSLLDPELVQMTSNRARDLVQRSAERGEVARLAWAEGRLAVADSRGRRRTVEATSATFEVSSRSPGGGRAAAVSRSLDGLAVPRVLERSRRRQAPQSAGVEGPPEEPVPLVLAPEAVARLLGLLNHYALSADSFHQGTSVLLDKVGQAVFHPTVNLRDDGGDPRGLPFPCDLLGAAKRPVEMIAGGVFLTPAVDERLAIATGLAATPHQIAPDEALAAHLFLLPGETPEPELLRLAEGGIWVAALEPVECFDSRGLRFRAVARGARRVRGGALDRALPDLLWEDSLPDVLSRVLGLGTEMIAAAVGDGFLGATAAPALALERVQGLRPLFE